MNETDDALQTALDHTESAERGFRAALDERRPIAAEAATVSASAEDLHELAADATAEAEASAVTEATPEIDSPFAAADRVRRRSRERIRGSIERSIETITTVIRENEVLAAFPGHEESARRRVAEGEAELARARAELAALDRTESEPADPTADREGPRPTR